jgi:hypothetical protein
LTIDLISYIINGSEAHPSGCAIGQKQLNFVSLEEGKMSERNRTIQFIGVLAITAVLFIIVLEGWQMTVEVSHSARQLVVENGQWVMTENTSRFEPGTIVRFHCWSWSTYEAQQIGGRPDSVLVETNTGFWLLTRDYVSEQYATFLGIRLPI